MNFPSLVVCACTWIGLRSSEDARPPRVHLPPTRGGLGQVQGVHGRLPLSFVENRGQTDSRVRFSAQGSRYAFHLTREEVLLSFVERPAAPEVPSAKGVTLALRFLGADPDVAIEGEERAPG